MADGVAGYFEDHKDSADLGRKAMRGGVISVAMQYGNGVLQLVAAIVLARILAPEDFGLVAIITVLTSFAPLLIDFGLLDATTQRPSITQSQVSSLFWVSSAIGVALTVVLAASSPLIAWTFAEPRLESIAQATAITCLLLGVSNQHLALLRRTMQFAMVAKIQFISTLAGIVIAIFMALCGFGYWALVARVIVSALGIAIGSWLACPWRPGSPVFDAQVKSMIRFGLNVAGYSVTYTIAKSADRVAIGLLYPPSVVGYFQNATTLYENSIFTVLMQMHTIGSATLSKLQSNPVALRQKYEAALSALAFFIMPLSAILSVTGEDLTVILLGEKWRPAGLLLSIIALRGIFQVIEGSQGWLHLSIGRADRWRNWGILAAILQILAVLAGLPFGVEGVAVSVVILSAVLAVPAIMYAGRPIDIDAALVIRATRHQLIGALVALAGGWWLQTMALTHYPSVLRIVLSAGFCSSIYLLIVVGLFRLTGPIKIAYKILRDLLKNR